MDPWAALRPTFGWRPSQRHLLELASHVTDRRWHLCAPPGAGKTLIGIELARRVAQPTLVLAPTIAIREQWRASTTMFGADPSAFTSDEPKHPAPFLAVTYQLLGNPGEAAGELRAAARRLWMAEVGAELGPEAAEARVTTTERGDPKRAAREVNRHVRRLRRSLATGEDVGVARESLVGERATALIEHLAASGVGCVVLDECHHLLDWWALVVSALIERLSVDRDVAVIGLTATLPEAGTTQEAQNYAGLLGEVDAELHLAAMVAEGAVAGWRDGVRLATVTETERAFLDRWRAEFEADLDEHLVGEPFVRWAVGTIGAAAWDDRAQQATVDSDPRAWSAFWDRDALAAAALARWWAARGMALPAGFDPPPGAAGSLTLDDRLALVDAWCHDPGADVDADIRADLARLGGRYGVSFTTRGVRWGRSVADLVCARSSSKGPAAATILAGEAARRGDDLRALVVVERDLASTPPAAAREVLTADAGTAARVLAALCAHPEVVDLGVMAVTGRGAWADALGAERVGAVVNTLGVDGDRWVAAEGCDIRGAVRLVGHGAGWTSARWLDAAEAAMEHGAVRVLLATRALVGEGWDHPPLNVLVDLSEVASTTATTQLRGRAIRIDARQPAKLASLWDVTVAEPAAPGDWQRLRRRHGRWWGPDAGGAVVTGPAKVHPRMGVAAVPTVEELDELNAASEAAVADVVATRRAWAAVDPAGVGTAVVHVKPRRRRRVRTRSQHWRWLAALSVSSGAGGVAAGAAAVAALPLLWPLAALAVAGSAVAARSVRGRVHDEAETLGAIADAVRAGLVAVGDRALRHAEVMVETDPAGGHVVFVDRVDDDAATRWADALAEALGPVETPRWMVAAPGGVWRVPTAVGATREAAEAFGGAFAARVPGAELVRAGTPRATELVLAAANTRPDTISRSLAWR